MRRPNFDITDKMNCDNDYYQLTDINTMNTL